jgi:abortive infection bacteriophage resistance protein
MEIEVWHMDIRQGERITVKKRPPKLSVEGQIAHLKEKGVKFAFVSEDEALRYLRENNNYFKLRAYRKGFTKNSEDQYIDLDFGCLKDLADVDQILRYCLLHMCLDIEHFEKIRLLRCFDESAEDGYQIVQDFRKADSVTANAAFEEAGRSAYCKDLYGKFGKNDMPIWAFVEILSFGAFLRFYRYFADRLSNRDMLEQWYRLMTIKGIRNASAHSNCIINDLSPNTSQYGSDYAVMQFLSSIGISKTTRRHKMSCEKIKQIATLLYVYHQLIPQSGIREDRTSELNQVILRMFQHIEYYKNCDMILSSFAFIKEIIDKTVNVDV